MIKQTRRRDYRKFGFLGLGIFVMMFLFMFLVHNFGERKDEASAADLGKFQAGYIISDYQMTNYASMSEADIQNWLTSKNPCNNRDYGYYQRLSAGSAYRWHFENGHFICLSEERFGNNDDEIGFQYGETAAHIIWQAAQDYKINPKVLLVLLQKETGLITDPIPNNGDYRKATGYGCPDTAACSSKYYGFKNQVRNAAYLFRIVMDGNSSFYPIGDNYVQYNPNKGCGGSVVYIKNLATSALYRYTPYQPNPGALAAGYGTASCGAYGNRNFYSYFEDWFGGVTSGDEKTIRMNDAIRERYLQSNGYLGDQISSTNCKLDMEGLCEQKYTNGVILYTENGGAKEIYGGIYRRYNEMGSYKGILGLPITGINCDNNLNCYQIYEGSTLLGDTKHQTWFSDASIAKKYIDIASTLGVPVTNAKCFRRDNKNVCEQEFEKGSVTYNEGSGTWESYGEIYRRYSTLGSYSGILGLPLTGINCDNNLNCYQIYEGSTLLGDTNRKTWFSDASIAKKYIDVSSILGVPTSNAECLEYKGKNACKQEFEKGSVTYSAGNGVWESYGEIYRRYNELGSYKGILGFPITGINCDNNLNCYQIYEGSTLLGDTNRKTWFSDAAIAKKYIKMTASFGVPISNAECTQFACTQRFEKGILSR